jgi:hypothetical protein
MNFNKPSITEFIKAQRETRGAGSDVSRLHAVPLPAVERMLLTTALAKIDTIEKTLEAARDDARAAARRAGVSGAYLFEFTGFIPRSTGHRWRDEAREEGANERNALLIKVFQAAANPDPRFAGVAQQLRRIRQAAGCSLTEDRPDDGERISAYLRLGHSVVDDDAVAEAEEQARIEAEAKDRAELILRAGERARSDGSNERPEPTGLAGKIVAAGKARRRMGDAE